MTTQEQADFGTVERAALPQQIAERILTMIRERQLTPGDRLPAERDLAAALGVGRPALREALRALEMMNVIEIRQGAGAHVTELKAGQLVQHLEFVVGLNDTAILELFEARKIVEAGIAEMAASLVSDEDIAALQACHQRLIDASGDAGAFLLADLEMHNLIAQIAANPMLVRFLESIRHLSVASRRRTGHLSGVTQQTIKDHQRIIDALAARDPAAARAAMLAHLDNVEKRLREDHPGIAP
jgi:GntR family transcriptional repressor for pyruvate dehydrogenase complex